MPDYNVGIITMPVSKSGITPLSQLIELVSPRSKTISLITGSDGFEYFKTDKRLQVTGISPQPSSFFLMRIINFISHQMKIAFWIYKNRKNLDILIFFIAGDTLVLPALVAYILRKKIIILLPGSIIKTLESERDYLNSGLKIIRFITCSCAHTIILYSKKLIEDYDLKRWRKKILIAHHSFLDFNTFTLTIPFSDRSPVIGYIGRLEAEKGVLNFVEAIPSILTDRKDLCIFIGGSGKLKERIEAFIHGKNLATRVELPGWIPHDDSPRYLNQMRLLVLPSYTEGLPNIMLEAMACGTPVLATSVGAITDVIIEGTTGFIMENNSPECIAMNVSRVLSVPDLEKIAENGRRFIGENFTFEKTFENWDRIFREIE